MTQVTLPGANAVTFTVGAEASNVINVAGSVDNGASPLDRKVLLHYWLSSDAAGETLAADPGTLAIGTDGAILIELTDDIIGILVTEADGDFDLDITHTGTDGFYLNVALPNGQVFTSGIAQFA